MINSNGWNYFSPFTNATLAATTTTGNVAIGTGASGDVLQISNEGTTTVFVALGTSSAITATTGSYAVLPGAIVNILVAPTITYAAAIYASGAGNIYFSRGSGV